MRRLSLALALLLASCSQNIWPGDEVMAMRECVTHDSLTRFESTSTYTTISGWHPKYDYDLHIVCRDGSTHRVTIKKREI